MTFSPEQKQALSAKLDSSHVKTRQQAGRALSYVEGWFAIAEANRIFGYDGWHRETVELRQLGEPREVEGKYRIAYLAKVRITVGDIVREGCGYGSGIDRDLGSAHESALKEAETDAMKRGLMTFGNPFGLALYDKEQNGVEHEKPKNPNSMHLPHKNDSDKAWKDFGKAVVRASEFARTVGELEAWQAENQSVFEGIKKQSAALHGYVVDGMAAHRKTLAQKEAA